MLEAAPVLGGWLRVGIPEYGFPGTCSKEIQHILSLGVEAKTNAALGKDYSVQDLKDQGYKAVYLAVGCQKGASLAIPGENAEGVIQGVDFLRDAALGKPSNGIRKAAVIGGGNVAIDAARVSYSARGGREQYSTGGQGRKCRPLAKKWTRRWTRE